jgi:hypothetical protein
VIYQTISIPEHKTLPVMNLDNLAPIGALSSVASVLKGGASALTNWMTERREAGYREFIRAALDGDVFPENAEAMRPEDLYAILQALEVDLDEKKAAMYGRLARAIALGEVAAREKRHFIKALQALTYDQMSGLQGARIASNYELWPQSGVGRVEQSEFIPIHGGGSIDEAVYRQFALTDSGKLTVVGARFVDACFARTEIRPEAIGRRTWMNGRIHVFCHELNEASLSAFVHKLTIDAHGEAIRVTNSSMQPTQISNVRLLNPSMIVLLYHHLEKVPGRLDVITGAADLFGARAIEVSFGSVEADEINPDTHCRLSLTDAGDARAVEAIIAEFKKAST